MLPPSTIPAKHTHAVGDSSAGYSFNVIYCTTNPQTPKLSNMQLIVLPCNQIFYVYIFFGDFQLISGFRKCNLKHSGIWTLLHNETTRPTGSTQDNHNSASDPMLASGVIGGVMVAAPVAVKQYIDDGAFIQCHHHCSWHRYHSPDNLGLAMDSLHVHSLHPAYIIIMINIDLCS